MKLPLYFISDSHISMIVNEDEINRREKLFSVFEKIKQSGGTLIIGGDFFDFWFHFRNHNPLCYDDVIRNLSNLRDSGVDIHYVAGNHDFWDFGFFETNFSTKFYKNDLSIDILKSKILITHGDGLLKNDKGYRLLKKVIRSKIFIFCFKILGAKIGYRIGKKVSNTSKHYNHFDSNAKQIKEEMLDFSKQKWSEGYDAVLIGHYHQKGIIDYNDKKLIFLGDWLKHFLVTKFDGKKWGQFTWNEL
tara:strand:- start:74 stop:811 length:738 start_codon:yes stop_codon:yes gene_type:complete